MAGTRILVVEDEYIISQDIFFRLESMGYEPLGPADNSEDAISIAGSERPDVILMDISLSGDVDGIETAEKIREEFNIPVIYVTAFSDDRVLERVKPTAPYGYLIKPFIDKELKATIETACFKHSVEKELRRSREQYRALLEASGAVPWEMDSETMKFTFVGPQSGKILGIDPGDMGSLEKWLEMVHPEDAGELREAYIEAAREPHAREVEYRVVPSEGKHLWIRDIISGSDSTSGPGRIRGYMQDITLRKEAEIERERYTQELKEALDRIKTLQGLLPICAWCKKVRDDQGYWQQVEVYIRDRSDAEFTHSICPDCKKQMEDELDGKDGG